MKRLIPALLLVASLFIHLVYAQAPAQPSDTSAEIIRFAKNTTTQQKIKLLDLFVRESNAKFANRQTEAFSSVKMSHHYPRSRALDFTFVINPKYAEEIGIKWMQSPAGAAEFQSVLHRTIKNFCTVPASRSLLEAIGITEMRGIFTLNGRIINQSRAPLSQCSQF